MGTITNSNRIRHVLICVVNNKKQVFKSAGVAEAVRQ